MKVMYKKILTLILTLCLVFSLGACGSKDNTETIDWDDLILGEYLPILKSSKGNVVVNSEESLYISSIKISKDDYKSYLSECEAKGYTVDSEKNSYGYEAYNEQGFNLKLAYFESSEEMSINLEAPKKMEALRWPKNDMVGLLPKPKSSVGEITNDSSTFFTVYLGETSLDDFQDYVDACSENGFNIEYNKGDDYYYANHEKGFHLSLNYEGNNTMFIRLEKKNTENSETTPEIDVTEEEVTKPEEEVTKPEEEETTKPEEETTKPEEAIKSEKTEELVDGMRPEFKEAMDTYESFMDEYVEFMKKYKADPSNANLLADYAEYMSKYTDFVTKFEEWDKGEMNKSELKYYLEVSNRVTQKLLEVTQN